VVAYPCGTTGLSVVANRTSLSVVAYPCGTTGLSVVANRTSLSVADNRWTLSVAGGYNRCVRLLVSNGVAIPFGGGQPTAPFDDCLIGVAPCGDGFGLPTTCSF